MKIIILLGISHDQRYSMQNYAKSIYSIYDRLGYKVTIQFLDDSVRRNRFSTFFIRYFLLPIRSLSIDSDFVHVVDHSLGHIVPLLRSKTIYTIHDLIPLSLHNSGVGLPSRIAFYILVLLGLWFSNYQYCVSSFTSDQVKRFYPFLARVKPYYHMLDSIIETSLIPPDSPPKPFDILLIGNQAYKNNSLAVHLLSSSEISSLNVCTLNIRDRHLLDKLERHHFLTSYSSVYDINDLFSRAKLLLCLSKEEGFGYLPFEASVCGCCPIMSDIPIFRELHSHSKDFLIDIDLPNEELLNKLLLSLINNDDARSHRIGCVKNDLSRISSHHNEASLEHFIYSLAES